MGKKGGKNVKKIKPKSLTPPDSGTACAKKEDATLGLDLGPLKLVAKSPFNVVFNQADSITLITADNVEFYVSHSLLAFASPYFRDIVLNAEEAVKSYDLPLPPCPSLQWQLDRSATSIDLYDSSTVIDALLRFMYPIPSPTFKEPVGEQSVNELPYRLMGPIYDAAARYKFSYVCQQILDIAHDIIHIKSLPEPGLSALRAYGVACRLDLDHDTKLKAARNALCVPYKTSPTAGLEGQGITKADIEQFSDFHKRAFYACCELLSLSEKDAYPTGLSDVYATFIACSHCNGASSDTGSTMRCGAARWWQLFATNALEKLRRAPLDPSIFSENFLHPVFREAQNCPACAGAVHWKWCNMMPMLAQSIPGKVYEIDLDDRDADEENQMDDYDTEDEI